MPKKDGPTFKYGLLNTIEKPEQKSTVRTGVTNPAEDLTTLMSSVLHESEVQLTGQYRGVVLSNTSVKSGSADTASSITDGTTSNYMRVVEFLGLSDGKVYDEVRQAIIRVPELHAYIPEPTEKVSQETILHDTFRYSSNDIDGEKLKSGEVVRVSFYNSEGVWDPHVVKKLGISKKKLFPQEKISPKDASKKSSGDTPSSIAGDAIGSGQKVLENQVANAWDSVQDFIDSSSDLKEIAWGQKVLEKHGKEFKKKVINIADSLGVNVDYIMAVMAFETGATFSPQKENDDSGATGLIQFTPTALKEIERVKGKNVTMTEVRNMSAIEQLTLVKDHLEIVQNREGSLDTLSDVYVAVLGDQDAVGKPNSSELYSRDDGESYSLNEALDKNEDGVIKKKEAGDFVRDELKRGRLERNKG